MQEEKTVSKEQKGGKRFYKEMTVGEALALHPEAGLVFASYHLGGCAHCGINEYETIEEVCYAYGVPVEALLASLNSLLEEE